MLFNKKVQIHKVRNMIFSDAESLPHESTKLHKYFRFKSLSPIEFRIVDLVNKLKFC